MGTRLSDPIDLAPRLAALRAEVAFLERSPLRPPTMLSPFLHGATTLDLFYRAAVTSGSYVALWGAPIRVFQRVALWVRVPVVTPAATTASVRLMFAADPASGAPSSAAQSVAAATDTVLTWRWLLPYDPWSPLWDLYGSTPGVYVQAKRDTGAGTVYVGIPTLYWIGPGGATTTGV